MDIVFGWNDKTFSGLIHFRMTAKMAEYRANDFTPNSNAAVPSNAPTAFTTIDSATGRTQ